MHKKQTTTHKQATETDALYDLEEKSVPFSHVSGLSLPNRESLPAVVTSDDYNAALTHLYHERDALYTLINRLRYEKLRKITSNDGWNPFDLQHVDVCTPIPIRDIEQYGYDERTSSCRCPNKLIPCTRHQAASDRAFWSFRLRKLNAQSKFKKRYDRLQLATRHLNILSPKGILLQTMPFDVPAARKRELCDSVDAVLCSVRDNSRETTQWSPWGGCSEKCNRGKQERFKITYNKNAMELVVNEKYCELGKCSDYNNINEPQCSMSIVPPSEQAHVIVRTCACSKEGSVLCSSEEARLTIANWLPQFREYCKESLNLNDNNNVLYEDVQGLKARYLGRFIQLRFNDGYYFDCTEHWGTLDKNYTTSYCKVGSPVLCREQIAKSTQSASFLETKTYDRGTNLNLLFTFPLAISLLVLTAIYTLGRLVIRNRTSTIGRKN